MSARGGKQRKANLRGATTIRLKVVPGASTSCISGWLGDTLKVRVSTPAEKGKANKAVEKLISQALDIPTSAVKIVAGTSSPHKLLEVHGLSLGQIQTRIPSIKPKNLE